MLRINVSANDSSHHEVDHKNIQKEADDYGCTGAYKSRTLQM